MPRVYKRKVGARSYRNYTQETLEKALQKIKNREMSLRQASISFGIHRNTLWSKLKAMKVPIPNKKPGGQTALTEEEERKIAAHAIAIAAFGFPVKLLDLRCIVKSYLDKTGKKVRHFKQNFPGIEWARLFIKRQKI